MTERTHRLEGRGIVQGEARGAVLVSCRPFSFLGDVDIRTGRVTGALSDLLDRNVAGRVLVVPATRGSAGAWRFIYQLKQHGTHPVAIITDELPDPSVVQGAILAGIPIVSGLATKLGDLAGDNTIVEVDGATGSI
ncbi:MAG: aconitase X swivel domain-containing protein, partial [Gammaproteobacteria bacterium]